MRYLFVLFACCLILRPSLASETSIAEPVTLTDQNDLDDLNALRQVFSRLADHVSDCMADGGAALSCRCKYYQDIQAFQEIYDHTLDKHPDWRDKIFFQERRDEAGRSIGISTSFIALNMLYDENTTLECE